MMFLNSNEKKEKANAISYKIDEYIWGTKGFCYRVPLWRERQIYQRH